MDNHRTYRRFQSFLRNMGFPVHPQGAWMGLTAVVSLLALALAVWTETWWIAIVVPAGLLGLWWVIVDFKALFFLMLASIPLSTEVELPGGFSTDFLSEPLMWILTVAGTVWLIRNIQHIDGRFFRHPITLMLMAHLVWMAITVVFSRQFVFSFKFFLAKGWYVIVFYFMAARFLATEKDLKKMIWWFFLPLLLTVLTVLYKHYPTSFSFDTVNYVLSPFYRNHVMYACIMAVFIPYLWFATYWYPRWSWPWWALILGIVILLIGINFAYTRAAYGALVAAVVINFLVRWKAVRWGITAAVLILAGLIAFVTYRDNWLLFAPDFERTVTHQRFESLLEATTRLEDISVMERVYRWVAASRMLQERPLMGFGPGNFYSFYKNYTVSSFKTYVSDNPERSGMHNYYLMTAVEQGIPGALLFIALCFLAMVQGQKIYHRIQIPWRRRMLLAALLCFVLIVMLMLMNDFVETDKIGSLFFISLALMVNMDIDR